MEENPNILGAIKNISEEDLYFVEKDLSFQEKASIAFLLFGDNKVNAEAILQKLIVSHSNKDDVSDIMFYFSRETPDWKMFLVEALAIVRANKVLRNLGLKLSEVKNYYLPQITEITVHINPLLKAMYVICEQLTPTEAGDLVIKIDEEIGLQHLRFYNFDYLEVFLLNWISKGKLDLSGGPATDVSIFTSYFKKNSKNNCAQILKSSIKQMISKADSLVLDKLRILDIWEEDDEDKELEDTSDVKENNIPAICNVPRIPGLLKEDNEEDASDVKENNIPAISNVPMNARPSNYYEINRETAGFILIINQTKFYRSEDQKLQGLISENPLPYREGSDIDKIRLKKTFSSFGYKPIIKENLTHIQILGEIREVAKRSVIYQSLIVAVLSHGEEGCVFGSDSIPVKISDIEKIVTIKDLENKPKIIIIQACQGTTVQRREENCIEYDGIETRNLFDIVVAKSTVPGYASLRHTREGTWFIQTLCDKIDELGDKDDILGILTEVNMAIDMKKSPGNLRMTPISTQTLRKKLKLPSRLEP